MEDFDLENSDKDKSNVQTIEKNTISFVKAKDNLVIEKEQFEYFLFMIYCDKSIEFIDEITIYDELAKISTKSDKTIITIVLNSYGGNMYTAVKIINMVRLKCRKLRIVIPQFAKSAATLMCLGADEIIMGEQSELGPLDKPIEHPHLEGVSISALDVIYGLDYLQTRAKELLFQVANELIVNYRLSKRDALDISSKIALGLINPIMSKEDPRIISQSSRLLKIAELYGRDLLEQGMSKGWKFNDKKKKELINLILELFVWKYPDHSYAITRKEAKGLLLRVIDSEKYDKWDLVWKFYISRKEEKFIKIYPEDQFVKTNSFKDHEN